MHSLYIENACVRSLRHPHRLLSRPTRASPFESVRQYGFNEAGSMNIKNNYKRNDLDMDKNMNTNRQD